MDMLASKMGENLKLLEMVVRAYTTNEETAKCDSLVIKISVFNINLFNWGLYNIVLVLPYINRNLPRGCDLVPPPLLHSSRVQDPPS